MRLFSRTRVPFGSETELSDLISHGPGQCRRASEKNGREEGAREMQGKRGLNWLFMRRPPARFTSFPGLRKYLSFLNSIGLGVWHG